MSEPSSTETQRPSSKLRQPKITSQTDGASLWAGEATISGPGDDSSIGLRDQIVREGGGDGGRSRGRDGTRKMAVPREAPDSGVEDAGDLPVGRGLLGRGRKRRRQKRGGRDSEAPA